jgi:NADP-dependent 3-hydroxy acid dehydrogenase YdfG
LTPPSLPPLIELPFNGLLLQADAHNQTNVQDAVDAIVQQSGKIDVPVTSAGIAE